MNQTAPAPRVAPAIVYPADLPITERREELLEIIEQNQVVIVAGETGSGKSTQLPKLCLELGRGTEARIGHTQPRRLAARSVAERIASELGSEIGGVVGYAVRFTDEVSEHTMLKLMTDGILLAEIRRDRDLRAYDTLILDEAHERSLNIDFLLGYLHQLLPRRPDLKVVITSATIDTERFATHFGDAPIVAVSGRTYPVEVRYEAADDVHQATAIADAVTDLFTQREGDVLVFCSGEREIRDAIEELEERSLPETEIVPLFARLSAAEQHRVFSSHRGRRVVVATNVAETSLTVPGIRSVVDVGTARISRFNRRTKVQRLPIEAISQASANQRAGRCGRLGPGVCIRLYDEDDFLSRPEFTEPEIQRTNLASVILQMAALQLGEVESFPFVDPPDRRAIRDGIAVLEELGAVDPEYVGTRRWLTPLGRQLARLPVDPRLGRMVLAGSEMGCLREVLVIASGLSVQDPRDRPTGQEQKAAELHARFKGPGGDFAEMLALWEHLGEERNRGGSSRFRRVCLREFINYRRVREWLDVHAQLRRVTNEMGLRPNRQPAELDTVHQALLAGLLSHVGQYDPEAREYRGARGSRFVLARGSALSSATPRWVMAGELVETNRIWARRVAAVQPSWIEHTAPHLIRHSYGEPWWDGEQGLAMVHERITLYGLPVVSERPVPYRRADVEAARTMFLFHALVEGDWHGRYPFRAHNRQVAEQARELEARTRRSDIVATDAELLRFFDERVGDDVTSAGHFSRWWKKARRRDPDLLHLDMSDVATADDTVHEDFPEVWQHGDLQLDIDYRFEPGSMADGVTFEIPANAVHRIDAGTLAWLVPGKRQELVTELLRSLPKELRRRLLPIADTAAAIVADLGARPGPVNEAVRAAISHRLGQPVDIAAIDLTRLPSHLTPRYRIVGADGEALTEGDDLAALSSQVLDQARDELRSTSHPLERHDLTSFEMEEIPATVELVGHSATVGYPALCDESGVVHLRILPTRTDQEISMWAGTRRLLLSTLRSQARSIRHLVDNSLHAALLSLDLGSVAEWYHDVADAAVDELLERHGGPAWRRVDWDQLHRAVGDDFAPAVVEIGEQSRTILLHAANLVARTAAPPSERAVPTYRDASRQIEGLVYRGFVSGVGASRLADVARYLRAIEHRLDSAPSHWRRDNETMLRILELEREFAELAELRPGHPSVADLGWLLQELRVATFAQAVGARGSVSEKRVRQALVAARQTH